MSNEEIYLKRDQLLGEIHAEVKGMREWRKEHDKKDDKRFFLVYAAILFIAAAAGVIPQLTSFVIERFK